MFKIEDHHIKYPEGKYLAAGVSDNDLEFLREYDAHYSDGLIVQEILDDFNIWKQYV